MSRVLLLSLILTACTGNLEGPGADAAAGADGPTPADSGVGPEATTGKDKSAPVDAAPAPDVTTPKPDQKPPKPDQKPPKPDAKPPKPDAKPPQPPPLDLSKVVWLHTNVSGWKKTANLKSVTFKGGQICLNHDKAGVWSNNKINSVTVNANPWVFVWHNSKWYGATWEWMRPNQTCKNKSSVAGDHIKKKPFDAASGWKPKSGQTLYFLVSGLARMSSITNVKERSKPVKVTWP